MNISVEMQENMALLSLDDAGEQYSLLKFPDFEHNFSQHPLNTRQLSEQMPVRDKYIRIIQETFRLYNGGEIISPSLVNTLVMLSGIFEENMRNGFPLSTCCMGENLHYFAGLVRDSLWYFNEKSSFTIIETSMFPNFSPMENSDCHIQGALPEIWKLLGNDRFDILTADGNVLQRCRISPEELVIKLKAGGLIFLYYLEGSSIPERELADFDKEQIGETVVYILRVTHILKSKAVMNSSQHTIEEEIDQLLNMYRQFCGLMHTLSGEAGNDTFSVSGFTSLKTLDNFLTHISFIEDWLLQHIDLLENPDLPFYANRVKTAGLDLWLEIKENGLKSQAYWAVLHPAYEMFCKDMETEFS